MSEQTANLCTTDAAESLREIVERQAREIERLHMDYNEACADAMEVARELAALKAQSCGVVQWPEADEIMQMAFEEGQPSEDASGYYFELEEFDLFIQRLMEEVARLNSSPVSAGDDAHYPPCDYCAEPLSYHPWHGSGLINGVESRHIHACDKCRHLLPAVSAGGVDERAVPISSSLADYYRAAIAQSYPPIQAVIHELETVREWVISRKGQQEFLKNTGQKHTLIEKCEVVSELDHAINKARAALSAPSHGEQVRDEWKWVPATIGLTEYTYREALKTLREVLDPDDWMGEISMHAFIDATLSAPSHGEQVREGWQLVPVEPTDAMLEAGDKYIGTPATYKSMLSACPSPAITKDFSQFLSAVMDAAGLIRHGRQSKELSEYLGMKCMEYRGAALSAPSHGGGVAHTDCRSEDGITVGLIDSIITSCRVLSSRDLTCEAAVEALRDLRSDSDVSLIKPNHSEQAREVLEWAVDCWHAEVSQRPLINVHRRALDGTWRQVIRKLGGDPVDLCGPDHSTLLASAPSAGSQEQGE